MVVAFHHQQRSYWVVPFSFAIALVLISLPMPEWFIKYRPDWVSLTLIFWCIAMPQRVGVGTGWVVGLLMDILLFDLLGKNAMSKALIAYLVSQFHLRLRMFPLYQQSLAVMVVIGLDVILVAWLHSITQQVGVDFSYWTQALVSMLMWPLVYVVLRAVRRSARLE